MQPYQIGTAVLYFSIDVLITAAGGGAAPGVDAQTLQLTPSSPAAVSTNASVQATLLGDLAGYSQLPYLRCSVKSQEDTVS
jgi:hypothetical protein